MTDTLFDATLQTARVLGITKSWKASTNGSTTTLVDTVGRKENDDHWNEGTIWIVYDAGGESAAPEGEFSIITDFDNATSTITFQALTAATAASDRYAVAQARVSLQMMIEAVNNVLMGVWVPTWDTTSLDTASNQTEYSIPAACQRGGLMAVYFQTNTGDEDDNQWQKINNWWVKEGAKGAQDTLVLPQLTASRDLGLLYKARHPEVYTASATINEAIDLEALGIHAAVECLHMQMSNEKESKYLAGRLNRLMDLQEMTPLTLRSIPKPVKFRIISSSDGSPYTGEVGSVRL